MAAHDQMRRRSTCSTAETNDPYVMPCLAYSELWHAEICHVCLVVYRDDYLIAHGTGAGEGHAGADDPASFLSARFFIAIEHDPAVNRQSGRMGPNMADIQSKPTQTRLLCSLLVACGLESCSWFPRRCVLVVHLDSYGLLTHGTARQARHLAAGPARATTTGPRREAEPCRSYRMSQQESHRRC